MVSSFSTKRDSDMLAEVLVLHKWNEELDGVSKDTLYYGQKHILLKFVIFSLIFKIALIKEEKKIFHPKQI